MAGEHHQFLNLLGALSSANNSLRSLAESSLNDIPAERRVTHLLGTVRNSLVDDEEREIAAILLRRIFSQDFESIYKRVSPEKKAEIKKELLSAIQTESRREVRLKTCQAVSQFARQLVNCKVDDWPEFLEFILKSLSNGSVELKETALLLFGSVPGIFGSRQSQSLIVVKEMLQQCISNSYYPIRYQAAKSLTSFILANADMKIQEYMSDLAVGVVGVVGESIERNEDDTLLKNIIEMAGNCTFFLRPQIEELVRLCERAVSKETLSDSWRQLALEVIVTLAETVPILVRETCSAYLSLVISACLKMMTSLNDDDPWGESNELPQEDGSSNACVAESAIDRLACGIGGDALLPHVLTRLSSMFQHHDWKHRYAALMAVSAVGEGCRKQLECHLPQMTNVCLKLLNDPHPRVRFAACRAIGQMSSVFAPAYQEKFHDRVIDALLGLMLNDNANPRVQAHAGAALVNFSEDCTKTILSQHLDEITAKLEITMSIKFNELLENGSKLVLEQAVATLASIANTSEEKFLPYYDRFMPRLKCINIQCASRPGTASLRGRAIECITIIGLAVGADKFTKDASQVMDTLLKRQASDEAAHEDPEQLPYLISAWTKVCKILGKAFRPYLSLVMEPVLRTASVKPEVALVNSDEARFNQNEEHWHYISLNSKQNFGINTTQFENKANACQMLVCYARELKEAFSDYAEQVIYLMVPLLEFYFHDGVRNAAVESLPYLIDCAKGKSAQHAQDMWNYMCPNILKATENEPEKEILTELLTSLTKCIEQLGAACMTDELMNELINALRKLLSSHLERADERMKKLEDGGYDEIVRQQVVDEEEEDAYVMSKIIKLVHTLLATYRSLFIPAFDCLMPYVVCLLGANRSWQDQRWAVLVFNKIIEFTGEGSAKYHEIFIRPLFDFLKHENPKLRQVAACGWGALGMHGTGIYALACQQAMPALIEMITASDSRSAENANATESAVCAVTKILKYNSSEVIVNEILPHWITWFPVWRDESEALHAYEYLCDLIESRHPTLLGPNHVKLPTIVSVIAEAFHKDFLDRESAVFQRLLNIVWWIQSDSAMPELCLAQLLPHLKEALGRALTT